MKGKNIRLARRVRRRRGIRKRLYGTGSRPRLAVFRSAKHIYAQIIDDERGITLCEASTRSKELRENIAYGGNVAAAKAVGLALAERAKEKNIDTVCFDRGGYRFHGRVKGLAEAVKEAGVKF
ncbi:MAG: 50S ribosomal protein L18 [Planctomycetota bacterium]